jgi:hypothetical protein
MSDTSTAEKTKPFDEFTDGPLKVTVWKKDGEHGPWYQTTHCRRYKDKATAAWKETDSYNEDDLLPLIELLHEAKARIKQQKRADANARRQTQREPADA